MQLAAPRTILFLLLGASLLTTTCASAGVVSLNGNCVAGNCANPDTLSVDHNVSGTFDTTYTFADGDAYKVQGSWYWTWVTETAGIETFTVIATDAAFTIDYVGTGPSVGSDTLKLSLLQAFDTSTPFPNWFPGFSKISVSSTKLPAGSGLSVSTSNAGLGGQVRLIYGHLVGGFGGYYPPGPFQTPDEWDYSVTFGEGTQPGSEVSVGQQANTTVIPEPGSLLLLSSGALGILGAVRRRLLV